MLSGLGGIHIIIAALVLLLIVIGAIVWAIIWSNRNAQRARQDQLQRAYEEGLRQGSNAQP